MHRATHRRPHRVPALGVVLLAGALAASGCSGTTPRPDAAPGPSPATTSAAAEPSPSGSPTVAAPERSVPPAPRLPARRPGPEGQRAFARHVIAAWAWSLHSNDASPLLEASAAVRRPCTGCEALARELDRREREGWFVELPPVEVESTRLSRDGDLAVATSKVDIPESDSYFEDGTYRSTSPAHDDATFTVRMRALPRRYVLVSFTVA